MAVLDRFTSVLRGTLWLVRARGLRGHLEALTTHLSQVRDLDAARDSDVCGRLASLTSHFQQFHARAEQAQERRREEERRRQLADQLAEWLAAGDLRAYERRVSSQNGEDGIIQEILRRVGAPTRFFVEFGVEGGNECNCARLAVEEGWQGLFIEGHVPYFEQLRQRYRPHAGVQCANAYVSSANIEQLLAAHAVPREFDLLSIDIDGNDYWVWAAVEGWRPRVVVIEYNASQGPARRWVMQENPDHRWDGTTYYGAS